jgi:hypothetical protein
MCAASERREQLVLFAVHTTVGGEQAMDDRTPPAISDGLP